MFVINLVTVLGHQCKERGGLGHVLQQAAAFKTSMLQPMDIENDRDGGLELLGLFICIGLLPDEPRRNKNRKNFFDVYVAKSTLDEIMSVPFVFCRLHIFLLKQHNCLINSGHLYSM